MYIQPQSIFKVLKGVPFHSDKKHTMYFANASAQVNFFNSKVAYTFNDFSYVKEEKVVRVPMCADNLYDCNYCMFQNHGFGNKWFFGFITNIEYINNVTSALTIEIDSFQTWHFDFVLEPCFVEREHVADDTVGKHTLDEGLDFGSNVVQNVYNYYFTNWKVAIQYAPNNAGNWVHDTSDIPATSGSVIGNHYTVDLVELPLIASNINTAIDAFLTAGYNIVNMYMFPEELADISTIFVTPNDHGIVRPTTYSQATISTDSYTPVNKKLLTYPYTFMKCSNNQGTEVDYKWENMPSGTISFQLYRTYINKCAVELRPFSYETNVAINRLYCVPLTDFPVCCWSEEAFYSWVSQDAIGSSIKNLANPVSFFTGLASGAVDSMFQKPVVKGKPTSGDLDLANNTFGYTFYQMAIKPEYARMIDDFFTRFGYRVDRYKVPELTSRQSFNYVKTKECDVKGNVPNEALNDISDMFNNGVTLWHNANVGNYNQNNSIVE